MLSPLVLSAVVFLCTCLSIAGMATAIFYPQMSTRSAFNRRLAAIAADGRSVLQPEAKQDEGLRRQQSVEKTLRQMEEKQRAKARKSARPTLMVRLQQAHLNWSKRVYFTISVCVGLLAFAAAFGFGASLPAAVGFGLGGGVLLPRLYVEAKRKKRFKQFSNEFPGAVDVIVRGVKSGLPLVDCIRIVATETPEPVRSEFKILVDDQVLGMPIDDAVQRLAERVPLTEASFFAIVIAIQSRTGGNLAEVLANLSSVLRDRKKMKNKIKAMSSEAKASGAIIGALPVVVAGLIYLTSPDYIGLLFNTTTGHLVLGASGVWMLLGILAMRKMINFDF